jgi:hypothetical protein
LDDQHDPVHKRRAEAGGQLLGDIIRHASFEAHGGVEAALDMEGQGSEPSAAAVKPATQEKRRAGPALGNSGVLFMGLPIRDDLPFVR